MTVDLPKDLETLIRSLVETGKFASLDEAMTQAARLLIKEQAERSRAVQTLTAEQEVLQAMLDAGLLTELPDAAFDYEDPDDEPVEILGEPLSETVIRERR
jgi:Arc/MetJ-type ribon-helix-helix transcriptional regulator